MKNIDLKKDNKSINKCNLPMVCNSRNQLILDTNNLRDVVVIDSSNIRHNKYPAISFRDSYDEREAELLKDYLNHNIKEMNIEPIVVQNEKQEHRIVVILSHIETLDQLQKFMCDTNMKNIKTLVDEYIESYKEGTCAVFAEPHQLESQTEQIEGNLASYADTKQSDVNAKYADTKS